MFSYIDTAGVSQLKATVLEYESIGIKTYLAGVAVHVDKMLHKDNFYKEVNVLQSDHCTHVISCATSPPQVPPHHAYITLHDAMHHALDDQRELFGADYDAHSATSSPTNNNENMTDSDSLNGSRTFDDPPRPANATTNNVAGGGMNRVQFGNA